MHELTENIVVAAIVLAVLVWLGRALLTAFGAKQTDSSHFCTSGCNSCQACGNHQKHSIHNTGGEGKPGREIKRTTRQAE